MQTNINFGTLQLIEQGAIYYISRRRVIYLLLKNIVDTIASLILLFVLSPILIIISTLICLDSEGPVVFVQKRVGAKLVRQHGRWYWQPTEFPCYKFRTMVHNADPGLHQNYMEAFIHHDNQEMAEIQGDDTKILKLIHDPRVTRLGKFLRKSSLDELPQLWNVVRGEMSLIGPRPAIPYEVELYELWHRKRLEAKPGMTGLWQVTARSSTDFDTSVRLDIEYIERQSFWLDLKILLKTPFVVLSGKGAQ
jgi:lipopolysaccharide/colanic/teichoic acid biosynthesis glycosyltransferase